MINALCNSEFFMTFLVGLSWEQYGGNVFFYLVDLLLVLIPTYMRNFKIICQGEACRIDKPPSLSIKTLKDMTLRKKWKVEFFQI